MKKTETTQEQPQTLKRKLMSALAMLLISTILLSTTSYAWFVLSTAPEVTGIETQVGANGSLEIALLNTQTRADMSTIRAGLGGGSLQENQIAANNVWGNLVDLSYASYGLGEIVLMPSRLNTSDGDSVSTTSLLAVPTYGYDGRIIELDKSTGSAIYQEDGFLFSPASQTYGVRAIGSADGQTLQGSALSSAQETIKNSAKKTQSDARKVLENNGTDLFDVLIKYAGGETYNDEDKATLLALLNGLDGVLSGIDNSMRLSLVAYAASQIAEEASFEAVRTQIMNKNVELKSLLSNVSGLPAAFTGWVEDLANMQNDLNVAVNTCNALSGGSYTWDQIKPILTSIMNVDGVYIDGSLIKDLNVTELAGKLGGSIGVTLAPGSGLFADIAEFSGNYSATIDYLGGTEIVMETTTDVQPAYLARLWTEVEPLTPAVGDSSAPAKPLKATYGYAIDLAFRCNAAMPDLVLQTKGVQRIYNGGENPDDVASDAGGTQGAGSYMEFTSLDENFTAEQRLALMDAIRVAFVDDQGSILAIAKLNVATRDVNGGVVRAPLYLYDYSFEQDDVSGGLILNMGERRLTDNLITGLEQNVAKAVTAVVWLDGDIVDNTMVSATEATSLSGVLNLQFATSAELVPARDGQVLSYTSDREGLELAVSDAKGIADGKQGTYTNVSWNAFMDAYNRAVAVEENDASGHIEIDNAIRALDNARAQLETVSVDALNGKIAEIRGLMGTVEGETVRYVIENGDGEYVLTGDQEHTREEYDSWNIVGNIYSVDYMNKNIVSEKDADGQDTTIRTAKYSDESWNALAEALYLAEAKAMNSAITDDQINEQLTSLEVAQEALEFAVFFTPYEYNGDLYYMATYAKEAEDTYGRWYDSSFNRIVSDVTILKLDAYKKEVNIADMGQAAYVSSDVDYLTPDIKFMHEVFPELKDVKPRGIHWSGIDTSLFEELMGDAHYNTMEALVNELNTNEVLQYDPAPAAEAVAAVNGLMNRFDAGEDIPVAQAKTAVDNLKAALTELYETNKKAMDKEQQGADYVEPLQLPAALTYADVEFAVPYTGTKLKLTGVSGTTTLSAKVLTEDGVVIDVSKEITIYDKADDAELYGFNGSELTSLELPVGQNTLVRAQLVYVVGDKPASELLKEEIKYVRWASSDTSIATVSGTDETGVGRIVPVAAGSVTITATVETNAGNTYTIEQTLTVK